MNDVLATGWTDQDHADAARLMRLMDAKAAGAETPAEVVADGFITEGTAWLGSTRPDNGGADRPLYREDSAGIDRAGLMGPTLPVRIEYGAARRRPDGGLSSRLRPAAQVAANCNVRGHAILRNLIDLACP